MNDPTQTTLSRQRAVQRALAGQWPGRLLRGELVIDNAFVRDFVGLESEAIPWAARQAVLQRLRHDLVAVSFSHGWGSPVQPDQQEALFLLREWRSESDLWGNVDVGLLAQRRPATEITDEVQRLLAPWPTRR